MIVRFWSLLCLGVLAASAHGALGNNDNEDVPYLELAEPEEGYHGLIRENETLVEVTPAIRARGPLCSFLVLNNKHHGEAPFEIMVIDENEARLRVRYPLNCEKRRNYKFDIAAVGCDGSYSNTVPVHITVTDVNEFAPVFGSAAYEAAVEEGRLYEEIVRVSATDRDCTPRFGDVCKYQILNDSSAHPSPFTIDNDGVIRNTEPLDYERSHSHVLTVVAFDCGMKPSAPVAVKITVNKPCRAGWKGVAERVDYAAGSGALALFPAARLEACQSDARCPSLTRIRAQVTLQAARTPGACDRDTYALHAQRTICGLDPKTVDLLPSPGIGNEWAKSLKPEIGRETEGLFWFDGSTSAVVPESLLPHSLGSSFTVSAWMKHAPPSDGDKHKKEHLLCLADDHKMNRHHYAVFVRNCRLILLLRRDFGDGDLNIFRPAEWRWKIPEVCDNEWHHYAINVRFPSVELVVDGKPHRAADGVDVIDDWPLHPAHGLNTTMVVGACWQGTEGDMKHYLTGGLAGLGVLRGAVQSAAALNCVAQCREGLSLAPDLYLQTVSVEGDGVADVETLLRRVTYTDARADPTPGRRNVHVDTTITCDNGRVLKARGAESYIMVLQPVTPAVLLAGGGGVARDYTSFRRGLPVYPHLTVSLLHPPVAGHGKLDSCVVSVYPALNPDHEALTLRGEGEGEGEGDMHGDIRAQITRDGVILTGADTHEHYQQVLRQISYSNKKPAYYLNRVFKLTCSELNGRFTSNEYVQTLTVVHPHATSGASAGDTSGRDTQPSGVADKVDVARTQSGGGLHVLPRGHMSHLERAPPAAADLPAHTLRHLTPNSPDNPPNHVALVMGVVCVGLLVGLTVLAVIHFPRGAPRLPRPAPARVTDPELAWDDSALTITVNPMDESGGGASCVTSRDGAAGEGEGGGAGDDSDSDSCSDSDEHHSDDDDDTHIPARGGPRYRSVGQLEWDHSTM